MGFYCTAYTNYKLVEKKQRRKEQGIYYTPKFVTDYIVKETVGRFLQEHSYNENLNIKILDPACGEYVIIMLKRENAVSKRVSELPQI